MSKIIKIYTHVQQKYYLLLAPQVISTFKKHEQSTEDSLEAGGVLLGVRRPPHYEVFYTSEPSIYDIRTRSNFTRRIEVHDKFANKFWRESKGYIGYLGEWHTHPERNPVPSYLDFIEWKKVVEREKTPCLFIIVGTESYFVCEGKLESEKVKFENLILFA